MVYLHISSSVISKHSVGRKNRKNKHFKMASSVFVKNRRPNLFAEDKYYPTRLKAAENTSLAESIQHERELKLADDEFKRADRMNNALVMKTEDLENRLEKSVYDKMTMEIINHNLKIDRDRLQHNLDNEIRRCQREKEKLEKDLNFQFETQTLKNEMELETNCRKADEVKEKLEKKIEKLSDEIEKLTETLRAKETEISDLKTKFKHEMEENEQQLIDAWEEKIRSIQTEHDQDIVDRVLVEKKLYEDKKNLTRDIANLQDENEDNLAHQGHEFQQTLQNTMEEVNQKWRKKYDNLMDEKYNNEKMLKDSISHLQAKIKDEVDAVEGQWKLNLQQKENEMGFLRNNLEKDLEKTVNYCKSLEDEIQKKQLDFEKELMIKLNERELEVKEECKKKLEDRIKKVTYNLQHEMSLKERDHKFQLERKTVELASVEESLSRAIARKNVAGTDLCCY